MSNFTFYSTLSIGDTIICTRPDNEQASVPCKGDSGSPRYLDGPKDDQGRPNVRDSDMTFPQGSFTKCPKDTREIKTIL